MEEKNQSTQSESARALRKSLLWQDSVNERLKKMGTYSPSSASSEVSILMPLAMPPPRKAPAQPTPPTS